MPSLNEAINEVYAQDAKLFFYPINFAKAVTLEVDGKYGVFIDSLANLTSEELIACLCHECGHCATGTTHKVASKWELVARHENKANRWAYEKFLPYEKLKEAMQDGKTEVWELSECFNLPEFFIKNAINYYFYTKEKKF